MLLLELISAQSTKQIVCNKQNKLFKKQKTIEIES